MGTSVPSDVEFQALKQEVASLTQRVSALEGEQPTPPPPLPANVTVLDDFRLTYSGAWSVSSDTTKYGGSDHYSETAGSSATLKFQLSAPGKVRIYGAKASHHGIVVMVVDDNTSAAVDVDCYSASRSEVALLQETAALEAGAHKLVFTIAGRHNPSSTGDTVAIDKLEVENLASVEDPPPAPVTSGAFELGLCPTSQSPVNAGVSWPAAVTNALKPCITWIKQHTANFGGAIGIDGAVGQYNWSTLDVRLDAARAMGIPGSKILVTLYRAPYWVVGKQSGTYDIGAPIDDAAHRTMLVQWAKAVVDHCYTKYGVENFDYYNEMKGYDLWWVGDRYMRDFNAIWDGVFNPYKQTGASSIPKFYGPYSVFSNDQFKGWGNGEISGDWGSIDPNITNGYRKFKKDAHGFSGISVDVSMGQYNGYSTGNYNPKKLSVDVQQHYFYDVAKWLRATFPDSKIICSEFYYGGSFTTCADLFKQGLGGTAAGNDGNGVILAWSEPNLLALVDGAGKRTALGNEFASYRAAHKAG